MIFVSSVAATEKSRTVGGPFGPFNSKWPPLGSDDVNMCGAMIIGVDRHAIGVDAQDGRHGGQFNKTQTVGLFEAPKSRRLFTETVDNRRPTETNLLPKYWLSATGRVV